MFDQARSLESAVCSSESYSAPLPPINAAIPPADVPPEFSTDPATLAASGLQGQKCFFCGNNRHSHSKCPACDVHALTAGKRGTSKGFVVKGSYSVSKENTGFYVQSDYCDGLCCSGAPVTHQIKTVVSINGFKAKVLVGSGSSESFIHPKLAESVSLLVYLPSCLPTTSTISMATSSLETKVSGFCLVDLKLEGMLYRNLHLSVLPELCADLILGLDFQSQHKSVIFECLGSNLGVTVGFNSCTESLEKCLLEWAPLPGV